MSAVSLRLSTSSAIPKIQNLASRLDEIRASKWPPLRHHRSGCGRRPRGHGLQAATQAQVFHDVHARPRLCRPQHLDRPRRLHLPRSPLRRLQRRHLQSLPRRIADRVPLRVSRRWRTISLGVHHLTDGVQPCHQLHHGLDQCLRMGRPQRFGALLGSTSVMSIVHLLHPTYDAQPWHQFLVYVAFSSSPLIPTP